MCFNRTAFVAKYVQEISGENKVENKYLNNDWTKMENSKKILKT